MQPCHRDHTRSASSSYNASHGYGPHGASGGQFSSSSSHRKTHHSEESVRGGSESSEHTGGRRDERGDGSASWSSTEHNGTYQDTPGGRRESGKVSTSGGSHAGEWSDLVSWGLDWRGPTIIDTYSSGQSSSGHWSTGDSSVMPPSPIFSSSWY